MKPKDSPDHTAQSAFHSRSAAEISGDAPFRPIATASSTPKTSPLPKIARAVGTPFYCYSSATIERHFEVFRAAFANQNALVCYAMKANSNQAVIATLARLGAGMDVVSEGELRRARAAGVPGKQIIFSGVGKTAAEMNLGLDERILCFNVELQPELEALSAVASARGAIAPIAIRVNPDIDARTHSKISTGKSENKFGVPISIAREVYARARGLPGLSSGASTCISARRSPNSSLSTTHSRCWPISCETLRSDGHVIEHVDLGGGLGIPYRTDNDPPPFPQAYAAIVAGRTSKLGCKIYP